MKKWSVSFLPGRAKNFDCIKMCENLHQEENLFTSRRKKNFLLMFSSGIRTGFQDVQENFDW